MSSREGFNIDELQSQILEAENYLQSSVDVRRSLRNSYNIDKGEFKNNPISENVTVAQIIPPDISAHKQHLHTTPEHNISSLIESSSSNVSPSSKEDEAKLSRYSNPSDREALIERLLNDHKQRKNQRNDLLNLHQTSRDFLKASTEQEEPETLIDPPLQTTIKFGSRSAENYVSKSENNEGPSLFRIMQSDHPVDVSEVFLKDSKNVAGADYNRLRDRGSPESLAMPYDNLAATIKFTRSLDSHEKFIDLENERDNNSQNDMREEEKDKNYHSRSPSPSGYPDHDDSITDFHRSRRYEASTADSLNSSRDLDDFDNFHRYNRNYVSSSSSRVSPATQTPMTRRQNAATSNNRQQATTMLRSRSKSPTSSNIAHRNNRESLVKQAEEEFKRLHTFTPQLFTQSNKKGNKSPTQQSEETKLSDKRKYRPERIQALHEEHLEKCRERERMKYEFEKIDLMECTFRPRINRRSQSPSRKILEEYGDDAHAYENHSANRLHGEAAERARRKHFLAEQVHQEEFSQYTFQPQMYANNKYNVDERPIHERLAELQKERQRHLNHLRQSYEQERSLSFTFQPKIDEKSRLMAEDKALKDVTNTVLESGGELSGVEEAYRVLDQDKDVGKRLMDESLRLKQKKQQLLYEREMELSKQMEPPKMSKGSQKIIKSNEDIQANFDARMMQHQQRVKATKEAKIREEDERHQSWFKPALEESTVKIIEKRRPDILVESTSDRVRRLSVQDQRDIEYNKKRLEQAIYGSITYTPQIDPVSKLFGRKSSIQELYENPRGKQVQSWAKVRAERSLDEECTFQPKINEKSKKLVEPDDYDYLFRKYHSEFPATDGYEEAQSAIHNKSLASQHSSRLQRINFEEPERMLVEIRQRAIEKEELRRQALIAKEIDELQECSFQPSLVSKYRPETIDDEPIVIRGLGRHMELRDMAVKIKEETQLRDYKAFHVVDVEKYRRPEDGTTIVRPFDLSVGQSADLKKRIAEKRRR